MTPTRLPVLLGLCLSLPAVGLGQDGAPPAEAKDTTAPETPAADDTQARLASLEAEIKKMKEELDDKHGRRDVFGWQIQLRGSWFHLAHNHRDEIFQGSDNDSQNGWTAGLGIMAPLWRELGPIDLYGFIGIEYRQVRHKFTSPILSVASNGALPTERGRISYLDVVLAPTIMFPVTDIIRPFVQIGGVIQVASPPEYQVTYLDFGFILALGLDVKVHERISIGTDYRYTWFGTGDQEDEDYGQWSGYVGFNF